MLSAHLLSLFMVVGLVAQGDFFPLLPGQSLPVAVLAARGGIGRIPDRVVFQPGDQAEDILRQLSSLQISTLTASAAAAELRMVRTAQRRKVRISSAPSPRNCLPSWESCLVNSSCCFPSCRL